MGTEAASDPAPYGGGTVFTRADVKPTRSSAPPEAGDSNQGGANARTGVSAQPVVAKEVADRDVGRMAEAIASNARCFP